MWLLKTEPGTYAFEDLERDKTTVWDGVRNPLAQKNLKGMRTGDRVVIYHTGGQKAAVGLAEVTRGAYPDPSQAGLVVVDLKPLHRCPRPVTLAEIKADPAFVGSPLLRQGRLSVVPLTPAQFRALAGLTPGGAR